MALLLLVLGLVTLITVAAGYLYPRLRRLDGELPDALDEQPGTRHSPLAAVQTGGAL